MQFDAPYLRGSGNVIFVADPIGIGISVSLRMTLSCFKDVLTMCFQCSAKFT